MVEKEGVDGGSIWRLMHPRHTVLVTCVDGKSRPNIITLAWSMVTSFNPPMVAISVAPERYSHDIIERSGEFVVNIPTMEIVKETLMCGRNSGRDVDKFSMTGLTPTAAKKVKPPFIKECVAHIECMVVDKIKTGDHTLFVGEIVDASVNAGVFQRSFDTTLMKPVLHLGFDDFVTIEDHVVTPSRK